MANLIENMRFRAASEMQDNSATASEDRMTEGCKLEHIAASYKAEWGYDYLRTIVALKPVMGHKSLTAILTDSSAHKSLRVINGHSLAQCLLGRNCVFLLFGFLNGVQEFPSANTHNVVELHVAGCSVVSWGTALQAGRERVRFRFRSLHFLNYPNACSCIVDLASAQPLVGKSTNNLTGGKGRPRLKADNYRHLWADGIDYVETSICSKLTGLHGLLQGQIYF
jgi:hypothetical protein